MTQLARTRSWLRISGTIVPGLRRYSPTQRYVPSEALLQGAITHPALLGRVCSWAPEGCPECLSCFPQR